MRLAIVVPGGVDRSGTERVIPALLWLIERLARRHDVHVFALAQETAPSHYPLLGARVHNLGLASRSRWIGQALLPVFRALVRGLEEQGPFDLVHAFWANNPGFLAALAARRHRVPFVVSLGGGELVALPDIRYGSQLLLRERLKVKWALTRASRVTVASGPMARLARGHGVTPGLVPLGVDGAFFSEPSLAAAPPRLLHRREPESRQGPGPTLLRAFRRVVNERPDARLDVVGEDTLAALVQASARRSRWCRT